MYLPAFRDDVHTFLSVSLIRQRLPRLGLCLPGVMGWL